MKKTLFLLCLSAFSLLKAQHTFSIVAVDPATGEVGSAGATCLSSSDCGGCGGAIVISGLVPGRGAVNAQATVCLPNSNLNYCTAQLGAGNDPQTTLANVLAADPCTFGDTSNRQYGIVDLDSNMVPRVAGFTGSSALSFAGHRTGFNYSVQGNILIGPEVLDSLEAGFNRVQGPLCEKLMEAMMATRIVGADTRCLSNGTSSKSAFIRIARPGDDANNPWLNLNVPQVPAGMEPIDSLKTLFEEFKNLNNLDEAKPGIVVFPNPAKGGFQVLLPEALQGVGKLELFDFSGKLVQSIPIGAGQRQLNFLVSENWSAGNHWIRLTGPDVYWGSKIVLEK
jgi:uncharacterized Ntn-hydrolase superfamily protein